MIRRLIRFLLHTDKYERIAALEAQIAERDEQIARIEADVEAEARALAELRSRLP